MNPHTAIRKIDARRRLAGLLAAFHALWVRAREMTMLRWLLENA